MKRRHGITTRPLPITRRRFYTHLQSADLRSRLENYVCQGSALPLLFILPSIKESILLSGPDLHGDIHIHLASARTKHATRAGYATEVTMDFRAADKSNIQALLAYFNLELFETKVRLPRQHIMGHAVTGHQPNVGHFLAWAAAMPSMQRHLILESAIDAGLSCDFKNFEHIHSAMRALDFMRLVRKQSNSKDKDTAPYLVHPTQQGLTGKDAVTVAHAGRKVVLDSTIDTVRGVKGDRLRIHYTWSANDRRYLIGWVSVVAPQS